MGSENIFGGIEGIQTLLVEGESRGESSGFATSYLSQSLGAALSSLENKFGLNNATIPPGEQSEEYAEMFSAVAENFSQLFRELNEMRSSYLPFELVQGVPTATGEDLTLEEVIDAESVLESYENTFFRMLGMPSTSDLPDATPLITMEASGRMNSETAGIDKERYMYVLDTRQLSRTSRPVAPGNGIYDFLTASIDPILRLERAGFTKAEELTSILATMKNLYNAESINEQTHEWAELLHDEIAEYSAGNGMDSEVADPILTNIGNNLSVFDPDSVHAFTDYVDVTLKYILEDLLLLLEPNVSSSFSIELVNSIYSREVAGLEDESLLGLHGASNFWRFSYLLFPPVQDGRIAKCINEPARMVAAPFTPKTLRTVNGRRLKSTLLEAVIRIRLDVISGTTVNAPPSAEAAAAPVTVGVSSQPITYGDIAEQMGLLEALIIARLFSAMHGFAVDVRKKIKELHTLQHHSSYSPRANTTSEAETSMIGSERRTFCQDNARGRCKLETRKVIEDSLLLILGDNEVPEVLELQEGVARNAGVKNAHLMSAVLAIMDVPRRWVEQKIAELDETEARVSDKGQEPVQAQIGTKLGVSKGVGAIDVLAFLIALFTIREEDLLSLLTEEQFSNLKAEYPKGFFDKLNRGITMAHAVNDVALRAHDAYQLFRYALKSPGGLFMFPIPEAESDS